MKTKEVNIEEIKLKLLEKLKPSGWADKLRGFLLTHAFDDILNYLVSESADGNKFTPPVKYVFRALEECPWNDLRVVMIGMDPYPQINVADGIAFSCSLTGKEQPSLRHIFNAIERDLGPEIPYNRDPDLKRWSNQGVLMLNAALTCQIGKIGSHLNIWKPFTAYLLDIINSQNQGLIFVFLGSDARQFEKLIGEQHYKICVDHPSRANYTGGVWNNKGLFKEINRILKENNNFEISW